MVILFGGLFLTSGNRTAHAATTLSVYPTKGISSTGSFDLVAAEIGAMSIFFNACKVAFFGGQPSVSGGAATAR
jgi:hypothetical protein